MDLRETSDRRGMRRVSSPKTTESQDARDDAAVDHEVGNACHRRDDIEKEVLLFGQQRIASLRCGIDDDRVPGEKERLCHHQPGQSLHDQIVFVLDLVPDGSIPIGRTKQIDCGHAHGLLTYLFLVLEVCRQFTKRPRRIEIGGFCISPQKGSIQDFESTRDSRMILCHL